MLNHGFFNLNPCLYDNYFTYNKFEILYLAIFFKKGEKTIELILRGAKDANQRLKNIPLEASIMCIAKRTLHSTFKFPNQRKYGDLNFNFK